MEIPTGTYRLQLNAGMGLSDLRNLAGYFSSLGVSHLYVSPIMAARTGSVHGYDMVDFRKINPDIGTITELMEATAELHRSGIGWIQDFVPNHMAYSHLNPFIMDVLERGRASSYSDYFDIIWDRENGEHNGVLCAPFLGSELDDTLKEGLIRVRGNKRCFLEYGDMRFPISQESPGSTSALAKMSGESEVRLDERRIWPQDIAFLKEVLSRQHYRLEYWKNSMREINYRRFFSINDLIALRIDRSDVYREVHSFILDLVGKGVIDGLRIDHIDGLLNPEEYLERLGREGSFYTLVEKILSGKETLPEDWMCQGTTGYDFLNALNLLFIRRESEGLFTENYAQISEDARPFDAQLKEVKRKKLENEFNGDLENVVSDIIRSIREEDPELNPDRRDLKDLVTEMMVNLEVYRTYLAGDLFTGEAALAHVLKIIDEVVSERDELGPISRMMKRLLKNRELRASSIGRFQQLSTSIMAKSSEDTMFFRYNRLIALNEVGSDPSHFGQSAGDFHSFIIKRCRQWRYSMNTTSTHDTKMGEDARARLAFLSEIPEEWFSITHKWHLLNRSMKTVSSGSEIPSKNEEYYIYQIMLAAMENDIQDWDDFRRRIENQATKAMRESGLHSSWTSQGVAHEASVLRFIDSITSESESAEFLSSFREFHQRLNFYGAMTSISQLTLKMTCPGVPDIYQGSELWNFSLTDPDNRRKVDFSLRSRYLKELRESADEDGLARRLVTQYSNGLIKLFITTSLLNFRRREGMLVLDGSYQPLETGGKYGKNIIAFVRSLGMKVLVTVVPRFLSTVVESGRMPLGPSVWRDTFVSLPKGLPEMADLFTGQSFAVGDKKVIGVGTLMDQLPVTVMFGEHNV